MEQRTVGELKRQLREEFEGLLSFLPSDDDVVKYERSAEPDPKASLLEDMVGTIERLRSYKSEEKVRQILKEGRVLPILLTVDPARKAAIEHFYFK